MQEDFSGGGIRIEDRRGLRGGIRMKQSKYI